MFMQVANASNKNIQLTAGSFSNKVLSRGRYSLDWGIRLVCQNKYTYPWIYNLAEPENVTDIIIL